MMQKNVNEGMLSVQSIFRNVWTEESRILFFNNGKTSCCLSLGVATLYKTVDENEELTSLPLLQTPTSPTTTRPLGPSNFAFQPFGPRYFSGPHNVLVGAYGCRARSTASCKSRPSHTNPATQLMC